MTISKDEYILRTFSKIQHKKWELYVITRIIHLLNDPEIEFVCQQLIKTPDNKRYLADLCFPELELYCEVDELQHSKEDHSISDENRMGVFIHYAPSWLRQEENQYLSCPPEIAKTLDPKLRSLMGYSKGGYVLGFFTDPYDKEGKLESVSPEKIFGGSADKFENLTTPDKLVKESS